MVDEEAATVASTLEGGRNAQLHESAVKLGSGTALAIEDALAALIPAAQSCGLLAADGEAACRATVQSGFEFGRAHPRVTPANTPDLPDRRVDLTLDGHAPTAEKSEEPSPRLWSALDLAGSAPLSWLARGRIPRAAVTILVGDEGIGKSLFWVWLVAAVTTGRPLLEFGIPKRAPGRVVLVLTEDEWASTVRPRLEVAGADLSRVLVICTERDGSGSPMFPRDLHLIEEAEADLVVVDAWLDTVPAGVKVSDPHMARLMLHPWKEAATTTGSAVLLLTHTNRVDSRSARDRYGITIELRKKARQTLFAQVDEEDRLTIGPEKSNLSSPVPASLFTIDAVQVFAPTDDSDGTVPRLRYAGDSHRTAGGQLQANYDAAHDDEGDRNEAEQWLEDYLTANPGASSTDAKTAGRKELHCSEATLKRAAKSLRVVVSSVGFPRKTIWTLPDSRLSRLSRLTEDSCLSHVEPTELTDDDKGKHYEPTGTQSAHDSQSAHAKSNGPTGEPTEPTGTELDPDWLMFADKTLCKLCGSDLLTQPSWKPTLCGDRHRVQPEPDPDPPADPGAAFMAELNAYSGGGA